MGTSASTVSEVVESSVNEGTLVCATNTLITKLSDKETTSDVVC